MRYFKILGTLRFVWVLRDFNFCDVNFIIECCNLCSWFIRWQFFWSSYESVGRRAFYCIWYRWRRSSKLTRIPWVSYFLSTSRCCGEWMVILFVLTNFVKYLVVFFTRLTATTQSFNNGCAGRKSGNSNLACYLYTS